MSDTYTELYYHFIWATKGRLPLVPPEKEAPLHSYIRRKCEELSVVVHALNGMPDHLHLACTLPRQLSISEFMELIKGSSSHFMNQMDKETKFYWQVGYGALTFSKKDLPAIVAYIDNQKTHHRNSTLSDPMEKTNG
jgi:REP element-mobilizing transposase RayT